MWDTGIKQCTHIAARDKWWSRGFSVQCQLTSLCHPLNYFWVSVQILYRYKTSTSPLSKQNQWNFMHLLTEIQCKHYEEEQKRIRISQYLLHWFNKLFICILWTLEQTHRSLCRNWGGTTYMQQQMSKSTDAGLSTTKRHVLWSKQHRKLAWRLTDRHEFTDNRQHVLQISHRLVYFQVTRGQ